MAPREGQGDASAGDSAGGFPDQGILRMLGGSPRAPVAQVSGYAAGNGPGWPLEDQAILRAMENCHRQHAKLRFAVAELVLRHVFEHPIDTLEFGARRERVAAGVRGVRKERETIRTMLRVPLG